jgi:hypothetical protein
LLLDELQLLQHHFQQPAVDWVELGAGAQRIAQLGRRFPITAYCAKSAAAAWVWCTKRKTSSWVVTSP